MRSRKIYYTMICVLLVMLMACKENMHKSFYESGHIPSQVVDTQVENLPGAAIISYNLPSDQELL